MTDAYTHKMGPERGMHPPKKLGINTKKLTLEFAHLHRKVRVALAMVVI